MIKGIKDPLCAVVGHELLVARGHKLICYSDKVQWDKDIIPLWVDLTLNRKLFF